MTECDSDLSYNFYSHRSLVVRFSDLELSADAGVLLARQAEESVQVCQGLAECIEEWREPSKITHSLYQLVSQRVYQLVGGYEDANDSNVLRHDPKHMYFPVLINEAESGYPVVLQLRAGNSHPGKGVAGILRWLFWRLRRAFPGVRIILRADAGFALPEILQGCERSEVGYAIGYACNPVTARKIAPLLEQARLQCIQTGGKARLFDDVYYAAATWDYPRRLVMKAEWLPKGANPRFVLTNLELPAQALYDSLYVKRGADSEHPIKELKLGIQADRLSCHSFIANQFRLLLAQAAYILMLTIRQAAIGTQFATAQVERLRSMLIKGAARVKVSARRVLVELAAYCPFADELRRITQRLLSPDALFLG